MTSTVRFELNNGLSIPAVGVGCWMGSVGDGEHVTRMVKAALHTGYRHVDTAANYGNERSVGIALKETDVPREELFLTTKLDQKDHGRVQEALDTSLRNLGVDYVDLYLMHWPQAFAEDGRVLRSYESPTFVETWKQMELLVAKGRNLSTVKNIGVSNFSIKTLKILLEHAGIVPAVNQVEMHPCLPQHDLLEFCRSHKIHLTAYSPVGKFKFGDDPTIVEIAKSHGVTSAQVLLSWGVQRGTSVIPKSSNEERLKENITLVDLSPSEMRSLDQFHQKPGMHRSVCGYHSPDLGGSCFGWTYDDLGWNMVQGGVVPD